MREGNSPLLTSRQKTVFQELYGEQKEYSTLTFHVRVLDSCTVEIELDLDKEPKKAMALRRLAKRKWLENLVNKEENAKAEKERKIN